MRKYFILALSLFLIFVIISKAQAAVSVKPQCPTPVYPSLCLGSVEAYTDENGCLKYACNQTSLPGIFGRSNWCPESLKQIPSCKGNYEKKEVIDTTRNCLKMIICEEKTSPIPPQSPQPCQPISPPNCNGRLEAVYDQGNRCVTQYNCITSGRWDNTLCPAPLPIALNYDINKNGYIETNEFNIALQDHLKPYNQYGSLSGLEYENIRQLYERKCKFENKRIDTPPPSKGDQPSQPPKDTGQTPQQEDVCQKYFTPFALQYDENKDGKLNTGEFLKAAKDRKTTISSSGLPKFSIIELKKMLFMVRFKCDIQTSKSQTLRCPAPPPNYCASAQNAKKVYVAGCHVAWQCDNLLNPKPTR